MCVSQYTTELETPGAGVGGKVLGCGVRGLRLIISDLFSEKETWYFVLEFSDWYFSLYFQVSGFMSQGAHRGDGRPGRPGPR